MKDVFYLLFNLLSALARIIQPGGSRTVIAENLLLKQQLIIHSRSRQRAPNLTTQDRTDLGLLLLFLIPGRLVRIHGMAVPELQSKPIWRSDLTWKKTLFAASRQYTTSPTPVIAVYSG